MRITIELRDGQTVSYENFLTYSVPCDEDDELSVLLCENDEIEEIVFEKTVVLKVTVEYFIN